MRRRILQAGTTAALATGLLASVTSPAQAAGSTFFQVTGSSTVTVQYEFAVSGYFTWQFVVNGVPQPVIHSGRCTGGTPTCTQRYTSAVAHDVPIQTLVMEVAGAADVTSSSTVGA